MKRYADSKTTLKILSLISTQLNLMHRVVARATLLLTWMHGFGWYAFSSLST